MQVYINGEERQLPENISLQSLLKTLEMGDQRFAVEVNQDILGKPVVEMVATLTDTGCAPATGWRLFRPSAVVDERPKTPR